MTTIKKPGIILLSLLLGYCSCGFGFSFNGNFPIIKFISMKIGSIIEDLQSERRVAITPEIAKNL